MFRRPDALTSRKVLLVAWLVVLLPALPGCITDPVTGESKFGFLSEEQEAALRAYADASAETPAPPGRKRSKRSR